MPLGKFTAEEDEKLIAFVKNHPALYVVKSKSYRNIVKKEKIWRIIAQELRKDEAEVKSRWKSIRDYYQRKCKNRTPGSATEDPFFKRFAHLQFLDSPFVKRRTVVKDEERAQVSMNGENDRGFSSDDADTFQDKEKQSDEETYKHDSSSSSDNDENFQVMPPTKAKKRQLSEKNLILKEIRQGGKERLELLNKLFDERKDDALSLFFKSMEATVRTFSKKMQGEAKLKILQITTDLEIKDMEMNGDGDILCDDGYPVYNSQSTVSIDNSEENLDIKDVDLTSLVHMNR